MGGLSIFHWLIFVIVWAIWIVPLAMIFGRIGYNKAWGLVALFPLFGIVALWFIAFARWPAHQVDADTFS